MAVRNIRIFGDDILRKKSRNVDEINHRDFDFNRRYDRNNE